MLQDLGPSPEVAALAQMIDGYVHLITPPGDLLFANARGRTHLGHDPATIVGRPFTHLVAPEHRVRVQRDLDDLFSGQDVGAIHTQLRTAGGNTVDVDGWMSRVRVDAERVFALAIFADRRIDLTTPHMGFTIPAGHSVALTQRQQAVLQLFASGHTTKQVASHLSIAVKTVHNHLTTIYRVLNAQSLVQATMIAAQLGLVELAAPNRSSPAHPPVAVS